MSNEVIGVISLNGFNIKNEIACCTGEQLSLVIETLFEDIRDFKWLGFDLSANHNLPDSQNLDSKKRTFIGDTSALIALSKKIDQFWSGVFIGFCSDYSIPSNILEKTTISEGTTSLKGAQIGIRAFDTSFFEIYSENLSLLRTLENKFGGDLVVREANT